MSDVVLKAFREELDKAFPDIVEVRKVYLRYHEAHPELSSRIREAFDRWLKRKYR